MCLHTWVERRRRPSSRAVGTGIVEEVHTIDKFHRKEPPFPIGEELIKPHQVRVNDINQGAELLLKTIERVRVHVGQELDRHCCAKLSVKSLVYDSHTTSTNLPLEFEAIRMPHWAKKSRSTPGD